MRTVKFIVITIIIFFCYPSFCLGAAPEPISEWKFNGNGLNSVGGMPAASATCAVAFHASGGIDGGYAYIPGNTDWISIPHMPDYNLPVSFTVEFWFRQYSDQDFTQHLVVKGDPPVSGNFFIFRSLWDQYNSGIVKAAYKGVNDYWINVTHINNLEHGRWHHVVYTKSATDHAYYLDGTLINSSATDVDAATNSDPIIVGDTAVNTDFDELRIYDQSLNAREVSNRYNAYKTAFFSNFEGDNGGLNSSRDWQWGTYLWAGSCENPVPPGSAHSGTDMWGTILNGCYNNLGNNGGYNTCVNTDPSDDSILSFTVNLSGMDSATLSWWEWFDVYLPFDWAEVYVNNEVVFQHCGGIYVAPSEWVHQSVDLTPYMGRTVTIAFHMMASSVVTRSGWYVDDIQVFGKVKQGNMAPILFLLNQE